MGFLQIYNAVKTQTLHPSAQNAARISLPVFVQGDQLSIEFMALKPTGNAFSKTPFEIIPVGSYSLKLGLFAAAGTQLAYQNTFTADAANNVYSGVLNLNTAAIDTAVSSLAIGNSLTVYAEIKTVDQDGNETTSLPATPVELVKRLITAASNVVQPVDKAATEAWVSALFSKLAPDVYQPKIRLTPGGKRFLINYDEDGNEVKSELT